MTNLVRAVSRQYVRPSRADSVGIAVDQTTERVDVDLDDRDPASSGLVTELRPGPVALLRRRRIASWVCSASGYRHSCRLDLQELREGAGWIALLGV
jgi:hypothetical protein